MVTIGKMRDRRDIRADCLGKARWRSEEAAQRAVTRIRREADGDRMNSRVRPYRCPFGGKSHWHIGHSQ